MLTDFGMKTGFRDDNASPKGHTRPVSCTYDPVAVLALAVLFDVEVDSSSEWTEPSSLTESDAGTDG